MRINFQTQPPKPQADQLTALIDLGQERLLYLEPSAQAHPAWADLERRLEHDPKGTYLAIGEAPLLYLPGEDAKYWDDDEKIRILAARAYDAARERKVASLVVLLDGPAGAEAAALAAEGIALRAYRFAKYKSGNNGDKDKNNKKELAITFVCPKGGEVNPRKAVERRLALVESINSARDLINEPGSVVTPAVMEARARAVAKKLGLKVEVLNDKQLEKEGYNGLLAVGRGGEVPPRMIVLTYDPFKGQKSKAKGKGKAKAQAAEERPHLGLLGKGVTFDTGGVSIKPSGKMWQMKADMAGAAAVLFAMEAIAREELPIRVSAVIVTAQNYVDSRSTLPGDIFRARNGKTVHVDNTDAEGRLILSDGLYRLGEEQVTHLVDVATLTGACLRALGTSVSGIFGNDEFADQVAQVAGTQGEPCWRLPMIEEYFEWLKCDVADLNNISSNALAGATVAALFLREFLPENVHWAHLDIAGTDLAEGNWKYFRPGATGVMVRTLYALAERMSQEG